MNNRKSSWKSKMECVWNLDTSLTPTLVPSLNCKTSESVVFQTKRLRIDKHFVQLT